MTRSKSRYFDEFPVKDFVSFDLETSGLSPETDEILEIGMVKFVRGIPVERWSSLVKPSKTPSLKVLRLTTISLEELETSPSISEVCESILSFGKGLPLVGHNPQFDVSFLSKVLPEFPQVMVYDTLELSRIVMPGQSSYKLTALADALDISLDQAHRACDDALASGALFVKLMEEILNLPPPVSERIRWIMGEEWPAYRLFAAVTGCLQHTLVNKLLPWEPEVCNGPSGKFPVWFNPSEKGIFLIRSPGTLETAVSTAREIAHGNRDGKYKIALAGFPHCPDILEDMTYLGAPSEYLCLSKLRALESLAGDGGMSGYDLDIRRFYASVINWASYTTYGHISEIRLHPGTYSWWAELSCPSDGACGDSCPYARQCYLIQANRRAEKSPTVMLSKDKAISSGDKYDFTIVWAFHQLDNIVARNDPWVDMGRLRELACFLRVEDKLPSLDYIYRSMDGTPKRDKVLSGELYRLAGWLTGEMKEVEKSLNLRGRPLVSKEHNLFEKMLVDMAEVTTDRQGSVPLLETAFRSDGSKSPVFSRRTLWPGARGIELLSRNSRGTYLLSNVADTIAGSSGLRYRYGLTSETVYEADEIKNNGLMLVTVTGCESPDFPVFTGKVLLELAKTIKDACILFPSYNMLKNTYNAVQSELESMEVVSVAQGVDGGYGVLEKVGEPDVYVFARIGRVPDENTDFSPTCLIIPKVPFLPPGTMEDLRRKELSRAGADSFLNVSLMSPVMTVKLYVERMKENNKRALVIMSDPKLTSNSTAWRNDFLKYFKDLSCINCHFSQVSDIAGKWINK